MSASPCLTRLLCGVAALVVPSLVFGQCPANPLEKLNGNWAFQIYSSEYDAYGSGAVGRFSPSIQNGQGVLSITTTVVNALDTGAQVMRWATAPGRYTVYPDCTGGELFFNVNGFAAQFEYVFDRNDHLVLVNDSLANTRPGFTHVLTGNARKIGPIGCPAGVDPLTLLTGGEIAFQTQLAGFAALPPFYNSGSVGSLVATVRNGLGVIDAVETVNNDGKVTRLAKETGRFQVYADCSGGEILLMGRNPAVHFEFVFSTADRSETYMVADNFLTSSYQFLIGHTKRKAALTCPANPLELLNGSTWSFQSRGSNVGLPVSSSAAIGRFTATIRGGQGFLDISETYRDAATVHRGVTASGRYMVYPDCSGGELMFMVNGQAVQYEFVIVGNGEIYMVSDSVLGSLSDPKTVLVGTALRGAPLACPAGVAPLNTLNGTQWSFRTYQPYYPFLNVAPNLTVTPPNFPDGSASVGYFKPFTQSGIGLLSGVETTNNAGQIYRLQQESGRYQVYPDCSGGEVMLMNRREPVQLEFVFVGPNFDDMFLLSDTNGNSPFIVLQGRARKQ